MGRKTGISWTDSTWNPIRGCSRVSEACRNCYAEKMAYRFSGERLDGKESPYKGLVQRTPDGMRLPLWNGQIKFVEEHLLDPLRWKKPRRIFVNSMSDLFHENVTDEMRDKIFAVMALCPQHMFQVLTKRPERMLAYIRERSRWSRDGLWNYLVLEIFPSLGISASRLRGIRDNGGLSWPLPNVHLGVSVEDQKTADLRIPVLLQTPAAVRFISAEPLLGPVDLERIVLKEATFPERGQPPVSMKALTGWHGGSDRPERSRLDWAIVGGESGPGARPMHPDWARSLRDLCKAAGVPFFFKQWGLWMHGSDFRDTARIVLNDGRVIADPGELSQADRNRWADFRSEMMAPVGAKISGCLLDGVEHHEFPAVGR